MRQITLNIVGVFYTGKVSIGDGLDTKVKDVMDEAHDKQPTKDVIFKYKNIEFVDEKNKKRSLSVLLRLYILSISIVEAASLTEKAFIASVKHFQNTLRTHIPSGSIIYSAPTASVSLSLVSNRILWQRSTNPARWSKPSYGGSSRSATARPAFRIACRASYPRTC